MNHIRRTPHQTHSTALTSTYGDQVADDNEDTPDMRRFGALLKQYRLAAGLTQEDVAERSGVSLNSINRWERGLITNPFPRQVKAVCRAIRLNPVHAWLSLGGLDPQDVDTPEAPKPRNPKIEEAIAVLEDDRISEEAKFGARQYLLWVRDTALQPPNDGKSPRAAS